MKIYGFNSRSLIDRHRLVASMAAILGAKAIEVTGRAAGPRTFPLVAATGAIVRWVSRLPVWCRVEPGTRSHAS